MGRVGARSAHRCGERRDLAALLARDLQPLGEQPSASLKRRALLCGEARARSLDGGEKLGAAGVAGERPACPAQHARVAQQRLALGLGIHVLHGAGQSTLALRTRYPSEPACCAWWPSRSLPRVVPRLPVSAAVLPLPMALAPPPPCRSRLHRTLLVESGLERYGIARPTGSLYHAEVLRARRSVQEAMDAFTTELTGPDAPHARVERTGEP